MTPTVSSSLRVVAVVALTVLAVAAAATARDGTPTQGVDLPFEVGEPFPEVALPTLDGGEPTTLAAYRGDKIILHVFASW